MLQRTSALILAAGQGTRMKSALPKVLHPVAGRPLIHFPVRAALEAGCAEVVVVVGHGREQVEAYLASAFDPAKVKTAVQKDQRGTGDAAAPAAGRRGPQRHRQAGAAAAALQYLPGPAGARDPRGARRRPRSGRQPRRPAGLERAHAHGLFPAVGHGPLPSRAGRAG